MLERSDVIDSEPAGRGLCRSAPRRGQKQKTHAAMDRKYAAPIVDADEPVDVAFVEQPPAQARAAVVRRHPGRQHEADPPSRPRQCDRPFEKELIPIGMTVRLRLIDAAVPREPDESTGVAPRGFARRSGPAV